MIDIDRRPVGDPTVDDREPACHWAPRALCGFPAVELEAAGHVPTDMTYAAWIHARRGHGTAWLTRHFGLGVNVAEVLVARAARITGAVPGQAVESHGRPATNAGATAAR